MKNLWSPAHRSSVTTAFTVETFKDCVQPKLNKVWLWQPETLDPCSDLDATWLLQPPQMKFHSQSDTAGIWHLANSDSATCKFEPRLFCPRFISALAWMASTGDDGTHLGRGRLNRSLCWVKQEGLELLSVKLGEDTAGPVLFLPSTQEDAAHKDFASNHNLPVRCKFSSAIWRESPFVQAWSF